MAKPPFPLVGADRESGRRPAGPARYAKRVGGSCLTATKPERPVTEIEKIPVVACAAGGPTTAIRPVSWLLCE